MTKDPNSPFNWRMRTEPSIFAQDPYFKPKSDGKTDSQRASDIVEAKKVNGKAPPVVHGLSRKQQTDKLLEYKQFGTYSRAQPGKQANKHEK